MIDNSTSMEILGRNSLGKLIYIRNGNKDAKSRHVFVQGPDDEVNLNIVNVYKDARIPLI